MAVYYLRLHTLLMEPPCTFGTFHINEVWVIGFLALAITRPCRWIRHYLFANIVIAWPRIIDVLACQSQLSILLRVQNRTLALYALNIEIYLFLWRKHLSRRNVLSKFEKDILREIVLPQNPLYLDESFGIRYSVGFYDFCQSGDVGFVCSGVQIVEFDVLSQTIDSVLKFYFVVVPIFREKLLELWVLFVVLV